MLALWQILPERSGSPVIRPACRHRPACSVIFEKPTSIIGVVEDKKPLSIPLVSQPVVNELKYVCLQVLPARDLDVVCDFRTTLFEPGGVARVYPENPCLGRLASDLVGVFDGELRLSLCKLAFGMGVCRFHVPNPAQADQSSPRCRYRTPLV
jgi:hypothetical protein